MLDYTQFLDRYSGVSDYLGPDMTEEGNVKPESDTITQVNQPVVAEAPVNPYVEQAQDYSMGVPTDQNVDGMQLAAATPAKRTRGPVTAPVAPEALPGETAMDTYIRSQESGSKPDIGYHYEADAQGKRKSTAYGSYGITAPAYRDIQMADPYFRGRPINSLSQTEQTRANQVYNQVQQSQLKNLGIEPTEENMRGAQLLGARGLKRYLETGTFSNEAARANGGAQNLERIVKARMGGETAPSSQPNLPPQPPAAPPAAPPVSDVYPDEMQRGMKPAPDVITGGEIDQYKKAFDQLSANANDPVVLSQLAFDKSMPEVLRRAAANQLRTVMGWQKSEQDAAAIVANAQSDPRAAKELSRAFNKSQDEGSWIRMAVFQAMGIQDGVTSELNKLGLNDKYVQSFVMENGKAEPVIMRVKGNGMPVEGYTAKGPLKDEQLFRAFSLEGAKSSDSLLEYTTPSGEVHQLQKITTSNNRTIYRDQQTGEMLDSAPTGMRKMTNILPQAALEIKQYFDENGQKHIVEIVKTPGKAGLQYRTDGGALSDKPPSTNLEPLGKSDPLLPKATQAKASVMDKMRKANEESRLQTGKPAFTEQQILDEGEKAFQSIYAGTKYSPPGGKPISPEQVSEPPPEKPAAVSVPTAKKEEPAKKTVSERFPQYSPDLVQMAEKIANYEIEMPKGAGKDNYRNRALQYLTLQINPKYDGQKFKENQAVIKDFATGNSYKSLSGVKTAFNHIGEFRPLVDALKNSDYPAANKIINTYKLQTGNPTVTSVDQVGPILAQEVMKVWNPSMGGVAEREEIAAGFKSVRSPAQLNEAITNLQNLMMGKLKPLQDKYETTGRKDFWSGQVADETVKSYYDRWLQTEHARNKKSASGTTSGGTKWKEVK